MNLEPHRLRAGSLPPVCAKTGEATTLVHRQWVLNRHGGSPWWILLGWGPYLLASAFRSSALQVELPISRGVRRRYYALRYARVAGFLALVAVLGWGGVLRFLLVLPLWLVLHHLTRRQWVDVRWTGRIVRLYEAHRAFRDALCPPEPSPVARTVAPAPGWYDDPAGTGGLRWWDGQEWSVNAVPRAEGA